MIRPPNSSAAEQPANDRFTPRTPDETPRPLPLEVPLVPERIPGPTPEVPVPPNEVPGPAPSEVPEPLEGPPRGKSAGASS